MDAITARQKVCSCHVNNPLQLLTIITAGVQGLAKNLANKMGKSGITFNDVAPAMITGTGMIPSEEQLKGTPGDVKNIPVGRSGSTEECANAVTMLCRTGYMTGQSLLLSGGLK